MTSPSQFDPRLSAYYAGKSVLITGGGGFIGRHLASCLTDLGADVLITVHDKSQFLELHTDSIRPESVQELDVTDLAAVREVINKKHFAVVFHLAAKAAGDRSKDQMVDQARITLGGTVNLATALLDSKDTLLVHIGSSEEYGTGAVPFEESQPLAPVSPYSAAKAAATQFLTMARVSFGLSVIVARPSVVFGPGQKTGMVIPYLFDCYKKKVPAQISPGEQTRDFVYVDDCIEGLLMLGARPDLAGECFNLGSGREVKLKEVAAEIARLSQYDGDLGLGSRPYRPAEVMHHRESVEKAREKFGWQARTPLNDGLSSTWHWWQKEEQNVQTQSGSQR
ncbi:MAG: NAD-dependent epimerase/dehydratase family protein [Cyanobacteria bacterium SZAS LIN-3]|nr:NAD-dependent epimerase/dehydratase family protein [Cyanobacteria bacterium SZAS LIN-3]